MECRPADRHLFSYRLKLYEVSLLLAPNNIKFIVFWCVLWVVFVTKRHLCPNTNSALHILWCLKVISWYENCCAFYTENHISRLPQLPWQYGQNCQLNRTIYPSVACFAGKCQPGWDTHGNANFRSLLVTFLCSILS